MSRRSGIGRQPFKRRVITFGRIIKTGLLNFIRNAWLAIAATAVMVITLTIILFSVIANATFANTIKQITDRIDISVYLKDSVNEKQRNDLISQFEQLDSVKSVEFVSKEQALENFKKDNPDQLSAVVQVDNPLPASLRIKPSNPDNIEPVREFIERPEIRAMQSAETSYSGDRKEAIDKITAATSFFRKAGIVGVVIFAMISVLIIFNTIRMAIFNRREELTIMRLLGANTAYIRGPFIVETILYGVVAAVISISLLEALFTLQASAFQASSLGLLDIGFANQYFADHYWKIVLIQLAIGVGIGAASSYIATRRYLKFKTTN
jgi:cell division transport system permease protein